LLPHHLKKNGLPHLGHSHIIVPITPAPTRKNHGRIHFGASEPTPSQPVILATAIPYGSHPTKAISRIREYLRYRRHANAYAGSCAGSILTISRNRLTSLPFSGVVPSVSEDHVRLQRPVRQRPQ
jgi:hypothetical protein